MKKIVYLFLISVALVACNSTEEIYDELDKADTGLKYDLQYTLKAADYTSSGEAFANFSSVETASEKIPAVLEKAFPQFGAGSSAIVNYNLYTPIRINAVSSYTLTEDDYEAIDEGAFDNLSSEGDIIKAVNYKYPDPEEQDVVTLTYQWFASGSTTTRTSKLVYYESVWRVAYIPTAADYAFMGQSFSNFDSRTTGRARIAVLFNRSFPFGTVGEYKTAIFTYTYVPTDANGNELPRVYEDFLVAYQFNGTNWIPFDDVVVNTLQLGNDGNTWVPDNTIKYTLVSADYSSIAGNTELGNDVARANLAQFGNFSTLPGYWTTADIIEAIDYRLHINFPASEVGQKYLVTYNTYPGGNLQVHLILNESDTYVELTE